MVATRSRPLGTGPHHRRWGDLGCGLSCRWADRRSPGTREHQLDVGGSRHRSRGSLIHGHGTTASPVGAIQHRPSPTCRSGALPRGRGVRPAHTRCSCRGPDDRRRRAAPQRRLSTTGHADTRIQRVVCRSKLRAGRGSQYLGDGDARRSVRPRRRVGRDRCRRRDRGSRGDSASCPATGDRSKNGGFDWQVEVLESAPPRRGAAGSRSQVAPRCYGARRLARQSRLTGVLVGDRDPRRHRCPLGLVDFRWRSCPAGRRHPRCVGRRSRGLCAPASGRSRARGGCGASGPPSLRRTP